MHLVHVQFSGLQRFRLTFGQAWIIWAIFLLLSLIAVSSQLFSLAWLIPQRSNGPFERSYLSLNTVNAVWTFAQILGLLLMPWVSLRRLQGEMWYVHSGCTKVLQPLHASCAIGRSCGRVLHNLLQSSCFYGRRAGQRYVSA